MLHFVPPGCITLQMWQLIFIVPLAGFRNYLGDTPLDMPMRLFPEQVHFEWGWQAPWHWLGTGLDTKGKGRKYGMLVPSSLLAGQGQRPSCSHCPTFSTLHTSKSPFLSPEPKEILLPFGHSNDKINKYIRQLKKNNEHCFFLDLQDTSSKISRKPLFSVWISINTWSLTDGKSLFISHINDRAAACGAE